MEDGPFALWVRRDPTPQVADSPFLEDQGVPLTYPADRYADLYFYAGKLGFGPREVDLMAVWEVAAMFGSHRPKRGDGG